MNHINTAFPEEKRPMMYKMMKWWGGKPHNIWSAYIDRYSDQGDIILDPFCGRGVGIIESVRLGRKAIGVDLNPIAIFQTQMISMDIDTRKIKDMWQSIKKDLRDLEESSGLFKTKCIQCHKYARLGTMNRENGIPYKIFYQCTCNKKPLGKEPTSNDLELCTKSDDIDIKWPYPNNKFPQSESFSMAVNNFGESYDKLYTRRNLYALAGIFDRINRIEPKEMRFMFQFAFVSMVHLATKIPSVRENSDRVMSGSWGRPGFLKVRKNMEMNPFILFERAVEKNQGILKGKASSAERLQRKIKPARDVQELLDGEKNMLLLKHNTAELCDVIPENSVDYVITDPPYGGLIQYFDLSSIWSVWLRLTDPSFEMMFEDEITIDAKKAKPFTEYHRMLSLAFGQIYKILKPEKYMTVTFHNDKPIIFNSILRACQDQGFVLEKILFQMNRRAGETGASSPWGTSVSDFYIRFFKPKERPSVLSQYISTKFENIVKNEAKKVIAERGEPTEISAMIPHIYTEMGKSGMQIDFTGDDQISTILHGDGDFVEMVKNQWWLSDGAQTQHKLQTPLSERVETSVISILQSRYKVSYDEVLQSLFEKFPNSLTPNTENIKEYLQQYAGKTSDGKWKINPNMGKEEVTREHTELEKILCKLGVQFGYKVWSPDHAKDQEMKEICEDFDLDVPNADRVKNIDVLWIKDGIVKYAFEVENSTSITSALERCSNIKDVTVKRIMVVPQERKNFLERKKKEPMFIDYFTKDNWKVIWYDKLKSHRYGTEQAFLQLVR